LHAKQIAHIKWWFCR